MALRRTPGIRQVPNASTPRFPILGCGLFTGAVSLRLVTRDNSGEMGGRIASPTLIGRIEELQTLEAARVRAANGEPTVGLPADGTRVLIGGCVPVGGDGLPYAPIVEALRPCQTSSALPPCAS